MTLDQTIPTRFGEMYWHESETESGWWNLLNEDVPRSGHVAAVHPAEGRVVVFLPTDDMPGGYKTAVNAVVRGATTEQLIDAAVVGLVQIGTVDPLVLVTSC